MKNVSLLPHVIPSLSSVGWMLWGGTLAYISIQDLQRHAFSLWSVILLTILTVSLDPYSIVCLLGWFTGFTVLKYGVERFWNKSYIGIGDIEILSILSSQTEHVDWFFMLSGCLGALYCVVFKRAGLPFVPVMGVAWCIVKSVLYVWSSGAS